MIVAWVLSSCLVLPQSPKSPTEEAAALGAAAEQHLTAGSGEEALLELWRARDLLAAQSTIGGAPDAAARTNAAWSSLTSLLDRADPEIEASRRIDVEAAKRLAVIVRAYRGVKWMSTAAVVAREIVVHDRALGLRELETSRGAGGVLPVVEPEEPATAPGTAIDSLKSVARYLSGDWRREPGTVISPNPQPTDAGSLFVSSREHGDDRIGVTITLAEQDSMGAVVFGCRGDERYTCDLWSWHDSGQLEATLHRVRDHKPEKLCRGTVPLTEGRTSFRLEVAVSGDRVECRIDGHRAFECRTPTVAHGMIGFFVSPVAGFAGPVRFTDLAIEPTAQDEASIAARVEAAAAQRRKEVAAALAGVDQKLRRKNGEGAAADLRDLLARVRRFESAALRAELGAEVQKTAVRNDPRWPRWTAARSETAAALAALAERYSARGWKAAAAAVLARAADLDDAHATAAAAAAAVAPTPGVEPGRDR